MHSLNPPCEIAYSSIWIFPRVKFDGHPSVMMGFLRNIEGVGPLIRQTNFVSDDWGTKSIDLKNELSLRTFLVMHETDGSCGEEGLGCFLGCPSLLALLVLACHFEIYLAIWDIS
ncbi:hypothetical protein Tco_0785060 [Tanacetum coccineum]